MSTTAASPTAPKVTQTATQTATETPTQPAASAGRSRDPEATRGAILQAAYEEMHASGFRSAGLDAILERAGVTKGALYHHFGSKNGLGLAVLDELVRGFVFQHFLDPVEAAENPIDGLIGMASGTLGSVTDHEIEYGCPLNNLAQEMSSVDEEFRLRLSEIFAEWGDRLAAALRRGQESGTVNPGIDAHCAARFIVAAWEGMIGLVKTSRDRAVLKACADGMVTYLESLRAEPASQSTTG